MTKDKAAQKKGGSEGAPKVSGPVALAQEALARGEIRVARARLAEVAATGTDAEKQAARERLDGLSLDPRALLASGLVLLVILFAAFSTLFRK